MKEFLFIYRREANTQSLQLTPEQLQQMSRPWEDWMKNLAAQGKLADRGHKLHPDGKTVNPGDVVMDGPFAEIKEVVGGYSVIRAADSAEAAEIAKGCPIFQVGGNVEVRELVKM